MAVATAARAMTIEANGKSNRAPPMSTARLAMNAPEYRRAATVHTRCPASAAAPSGGGPWVRYVDPAPTIRMTVPSAAPDAAAATEPGLREHFAVLARRWRTIATAVVVT